MKDHKVFLDTNVLVYAHDLSAGKKRKVAMDIMIDLWERGKGVLSTQVLQEFYVVVTRKIPTPLDAGTARGIVEDLLFWYVVVNNGKSILDAITITEKYGFSFWDALVIQAAITGGAKILLSEDLSPGQVIEGVKVESPFGLSTDPV